MNSYNENLHSTIVTSLQALDIEEQNLKSQVNAAMFTLYHAEGATITAEQNLGTAKDTFKIKSVTQNEAVKDNNVSINLLSTATQGNQYVKQSTTNIAVCASNVQISANAIVRLASDIGSIYGIVNAADFDSDIYFLARDARELMNETAYDAEIASQLAMEASMLTAEVSAPTVFDMAKATNTLMSSVLKITTADFDTATQNIATDNAALAAVKSTEKLDEGALEMVSISYNATRAAYDLTNRELNLGLNVKTNERNPLSFTVEFNLIKSPFSLEKAVGNPMYPVEKYYIMVVKEQKKQTFSISNAENILLMENTEAISVVPPKTSHVSQVVNVYSGLEGKHVPVVTDSDNEEIKLGVSYVVFVMAIYTDDYKRKINCYDDYLSAPSQAFTLTTKLESIAAKAIEIKPYNAKELSDDERNLAEDFRNDQLKNRANIDDEETLTDFTYVLNFESKESPNTEVEYRCMLLPFSPNGSDKLLTSQSLEFLIESEIANLEEISSEFDPEIAKLQAESYTNELKLGLLTTQLSELNEQLAAFVKNDGVTDDEAAAKQQSLKADQKSLNAQLKELQKNQDTTTNLLDYLTKEKSKMINEKARVDVAKPGFLFNVPIAEQVYADSYTVAKKQAGTTDGGSQWTAFFGPDSTDNFGNRLNPKEQYLPVILSYSTAAAENAADFVNALSDMANTPYFQY